MSEEDAEEEDVRAEEQTGVEQGLWKGERMPSTESVFPAGNQGVRAHGAIALNLRVLLAEVRLSECQCEPDQNPMRSPFGIS